jgi:RND superfamily putative drug exporter
LIRLFEKLGNMVIARPWWIIATWIGAGALVVILSPQLVTFTSNNNSSFLPSSYESVQAQNVTSKYFPSVSGASGTIVVSAANGGELSTADQQKVDALATSLSDDKITSVEEVTTSALYLSTNQKVQLVQVRFSGQAGDAGPNAAVPIVRERTSSFLAGSGLTGGLTGNAAISVDSTAAFDNAELIITIATVLLILLLLGIVFRSVLIAVLPIVVIGLPPTSPTGFILWSDRSWLHCWWWSCSESELTTSCSSCSAIENTLWMVINQRRHFDFR